MMDYTIDDVINIPFTTRQFSDGVPTVLTGSQTVEIYEDASITPIVEGAGKLVLTVSLNSIAGFNMATATLSAANGFEAGKHYTLIIKTGTVGGTSVVGEVVGEFTVGFHSATVDLANGTDGLGAIKAETALILTDTGTTLDGKIDTIGTDTAATQVLAAGATGFAAIDTVVDGIQTDLDNATDGLGAIKAETALILTDTGTTLDTNVTAIKTATDKLTFTTANQVDANTLAINSATVVGDGNAVPWDGA